MWVHRRNRVLQHTDEITRSTVNHLSEPHPSFATHIDQPPITGHDPIFISPPTYGDYASGSYEEPERSPEALQGSPTTPIS